jgi:hypothetical protein
MNAGFAVVAVVRTVCFTSSKVLSQTQKHNTFKILTATNNSINNEKFTMNYTKGNLLAEFLTE